MSDMSPNSVPHSLSLSLSNIHLFRLNFDNFKSSDPLIWMDSRGDEEWLTGVPLILNLLFFRAEPAALSESPEWNNKGKKSWYISCIFFSKLSAIMVWDEVQRRHWITLLSRIFSTEIPLSDSSNAHVYARRLLSTDQSNFKIKV